MIDFRYDVSATAGAYLNQLEFLHWFLIVLACGGARVQECGPISWSLFYEKA